MNEKLRHHKLPRKAVVEKKSRRKAWAEARAAKRYASYAGGKS